MGIRKKVFTNAVLLMLGITLLSSCADFDGVNEMEVVRPEAEYAIPLLKADINMQSLLEQFDEYTQFDTTDSGVILFRYSGDLLKRTSSDIFQSIENSLNGALIPIPDTVFPIPFNSPDGMEINLLDVRTGSINYAFSTDVEEDFTLTIRFPQLFTNGVSYEETKEYSYNGNTISGFGSVSLPGKRLLADDMGNVNIEYEAVTASGEEFLLGTFGLQIIDLTFSYAEGKFLNQTHEGQLDTIEIEVFENWKGGEIFFEDPKITIRVDNSFGVPTRSVVDKFDITNVENEIYSLEGPAISDGIDFDYPELDEVGETKTTTFTFDKDNSNVQTILGTRPVFIEYLVDAITNPDGNEEVIGFIWENSEYSVNVEVELPICGKVIDFLVLDTFELDMSFLGDDLIKEAELKLYYETELPIGIGMQLRMLDENDNEIGVIFPDGPVDFNAANVDMDGEVVSSSSEELRFVLSESDIDNISISKKLILDANFNTPQNDEVSVKVRPNQSLGFNLGIKIKR